MMPHDWINHAIETGFIKKRKNKIVLTGKYKKAIFKAFNELRKKQNTIYQDDLRYFVVASIFYHLGASTEWEISGLAPVLEPHFLGYYNKHLKMK